VPLDQHFFYKNGILHCDGVSLNVLAKKFGTPLFVTSKAAILENFERFEAAFQPLNHLTCYSVKANYTLEVIRTLVEAGSGLDVNSGGELFRALKVGAPPEKNYYGWRWQNRTRNRIRPPKQNLNAQSRITI